MNNIDRLGNLLLDSVAHVHADSNDRMKFGIRPGDILFNSKNSGDLIGKTAVADERIAGWVFNENIMRLRFDAPVLPAYAGVWFLSRQARQQITEAASASTNVAAVYFRSLREFQMWVPSVETQRHIVAEFAQVKDEAERLKQAMRREGGRAYALRNSLFSAASSGRLSLAETNLDRALCEIEAQREVMAG